MNQIAQTVDVTGALSAIQTERLLRSAHGEIDPPRTLGIDEWPPDYARVHAWRQQQLSLFKLDPTVAIGAKRYYATRPVEFINHWCDTYDPRNAGSDLPVWMPLVLFRRQEELVMFIMACIQAEASGMVEKSRDMGATWIGAAVSVWMWLYWPASAVGWGSNKQEKVDRLGDPDSVMEKIRLLIRRIPDIFLPDNVFDGDHLKQYVCRNPETGATIRGEIGSNIGRGGRTRAYFVDEAAHLDHPEAVEASLSENTRVRIDISSVSGLGTIFHRARESGYEWEPGKLITREATNVFVMDWSHHPTKTKDWYRARRRHFESRGLAHVFAREIERDYAASIEGVVIQSEWIEASIDAHKVIKGFDDSGSWVAGLDVADEGLDKNALVARKGWILKHAEDWAKGDTGESARYAVGVCAQFLPMSLQYDCIGVGAGVKAEFNRLRADGLFPSGITLTPWNAGKGVLDPYAPVIPGDKDSPLNRDHFANFKAQAWWQAGRRFFRTYQAVVEGVEHDPSELISLDSKSLGPVLPQLKKELAQPTIDKDTRLKLIVNKTPEGTKSPNLGDGAIMSIWPWRPSKQRTRALIAPKFLPG